MCFRFLSRCALVLAIAAPWLGCARGAGRADAVKVATPRASRRVLHVAADPNNLPFSNDRLQGFENKIAEVIAKEMDAEVQYVWRAQRRGFFRHAFKEDGCELVLGVPAGFEMAATTAPYYRSTYVFVTRADGRLNVRSFDDPTLRGMRIGIQVVGDEGSITPAGQALARRGLANNLVGYSLYGDYREDSPPARIIDAVAAGEVDVAVVWGPLAGYFAKRSAVPLEVVPVSPAVEPPGLPFAFDISMGVRKGEQALRDELNGVIVRRRAEIDRILDEYGVPRLTAAAGEHASSR